MAHRHKKVVKPANSFMLFRGDFMRNNIPTTKQKDQGNVSKLAKERWDYIKRFKPQEYEFWVRKAKQLALVHRERHSDYIFYTPGRRVQRDCQSLNTTIDFEGPSTAREKGIDPPRNAFQPPPLRHLYQDQQYTTPDSFPPHPTRSDSCSTKNTSDDVLFDGEELDIEIGSYGCIVTMLDFHDRGIQTSMSKVDDEFFQ